MTTPCIVCNKKINNHDMKTHLYEACVKSLSPDCLLTCIKLLEADLIELRLESSKKMESDVDKYIALLNETARLNDYVNSDKSLVDDLLYAIGLLENMKPVPPDLLSSLIMDIDIYKNKYIESESNKYANDENYIIGDDSDEILSYISKFGDLCDKVHKIDIGDAI